MASIKPSVANPDSYLTGKLLIAMPRMGDPRFHKAVIFVCTHDENGAMGLVINQVSPRLVFKGLLEQLKITSDIEFDPVAFPDIPVMNGGPVEQVRGFLLHSSDFVQKDTVPVDGDYGVTGTIDALKAVVTGKRPDHMLFALGYAGWEPGQLEDELRQNVWLVVSPDTDLVFETPASEKWLMAIRKLGCDPAMLSGEVGRA